MYKKCTSCKQVKPFEAFHKRAKSKDGLTASCSACINERNKQKYNTDEDYRVSKIVYQSQYREQVRHD